MNNIFFYLLALLAGMGIAAQGGINAQLRSVVGNPVMATLISFLVGTIVIVIYLGLFERASFSSLSQLKTMPLYKWSGGIIGALYVCSVIILAPKIGAANMLGLIVAGQMILAIILDHFGLLGFAQHGVNLYRALGTILLIMGVILIVKN
jgi:bacterial/archaeal transporter family-2 protein